jgi:hypothetical protein
MTCPAERVDHLVTQYVWALENDSEIVPSLKEKVRDGHFRDFSVAIRNAILPIRRLIGDYNKPEELLVWELAYIYLETWFRLDGYGKALTTQSSNRVWQESVTSINTVGLYYTDRGVRTSPQPTTNPCAEILISQPQPCVLAEPEKEIPVSKKIIIANVTFINNVDVTTMKEDQLIDAIKTIEAEIADLKAVKTKSAKIAAKIAEAQETLTKVVEILDSRP